MMEDSGIFLKECSSCGSEHLFYKLPAETNLSIRFQAYTLLRHRILFVPVAAALSGDLRLLRFGVTKLVRLTVIVLKLFFSDTFQSLTFHRREVREAPGTRILRIADFLYSPATVEKIFKQEVADWRLEYFEALKEGRNWKARWSRVVTVGPSRRPWASTELFPGSAESSVESRFLTPKDFHLTHSPDQF